jgi:LuxR family maltose regulon positive regulatory protein
MFGIGGVRSTLEAARRAVESEPQIISPRAALMRFGLGSSYFLSGETSGARKWLEEALELMMSGQPLLRTVCLSYLAIVATDEGRLEEAESLAREARTLTDRFGLWVIPQSSWVPIAFGYVLAKRGDLLEAQAELESGLSVRRKLPNPSPWPTLIGLLELASVRSARGDRDAAQTLLAEARTILEPFSHDAGIFPELLERQEERSLRTTIKRRNGSLRNNGKLTERELDVLKLLEGELSTRQMARGLYLAPNTVRTHIKSIYRKLGVSSRKQAVEEAYLRKLLL